MGFLTEKHNTIREYALILAGTTLLAAAITVFLAPAGFVTGGVSGLGIIIRDATKNRFNGGIPLWLTNIALNAPLFLLGAKARGLRFLRRTAFATAIFSPALYVTGFIITLYPELQNVDAPLAAVFGGALSGTGLGLVFRAGATTGGGDLAATIIHKYKPHVAVPKILFMLDAAIIAVGLFYFGPVSAMYAIVAVFISTNVISVTLEGLSFAKAAFVISERNAEIAECIMTGLERGATLLRATGMYTSSERGVLLCVVSKKEIVKLKDLVREKDVRAFVIVADVREVLGEGFNE